MCVSLEGVGHADSAKSGVWEPANNYLISRKYSYILHRTLKAIQPEAGFLRLSVQDIRRVIFAFPSAK